MENGPGMSRWNISYWTWGTFQPAMLVYQKVPSFLGRCTLVKRVSSELLKPWNKQEKRQVYATHRAKDGYLCPKGQHPFKPAWSIKGSKFVSFEQLHACHFFFWYFSRDFFLQDIILCVSEVHSLQCWSNPWLISAIVGIQCFGLVQFVWYRSAEPPPWNARNKCLMPQNSLGWQELIWFTHVFCDGFSGRFDCKIQT